MTITFDKVRFVSDALNATVGAVLCLVVLYFTGHLA